MTEWRAIPGWDGYYEVSDDGQVRSLPRIILRRDGTSQRVPGRPLMLCENNRGYWMVHLKRNKQRTPMTVHRAVLTSFVGPRPPGQVARHLDGDRKNNLLSNPCWGTYRENGLDSIRHGTCEKSNRLWCPRNHILEPPNLTLESMRRGHRDCLACKRASANLAYAKRMGRPFDFEAVADQHFREIMNGERPVTDRRGRGLKGLPRGTSIRRAIPAQRGAASSRDSAAPDRRQP